MKNDLLNSESSALIDMRSVSRIFSTSGEKIHALENITISIKEGEFVSVVGRSGSGKSTLMNMITGIDHPTIGQITVSGIDIGSKSENEMAAWRCRTLGIVFQFYQLIPVLSVLDNVVLPMQLLHLKSTPSHQKQAEMLLRAVDLWNKKDRFPAQLSGGEQQRAALARALANDPAILIADEPTGNLSTSEAESVMDLFNNSVSEGRTVIYVTHDLELAEKADRTITLRDGMIKNDEIRKKKKTTTEK